MVQGVGRGEGETTEEASKGKIALKVERGKAKFEISVRGRAVGESEERGKGSVEGGLEGFEGGRASKDNGVNQGVDSDADIPETKEDEGRLLP